MYSPVVLICPSGVGKDALDTEAHFGFRLLLADHSGQAAGDFFAALGKIFRDVVEHLRAIMRHCLAPAFRFARGFDGVANVLAVAERRLSKQTPVGGAHFDAVTRIWPRLFAADVELHSAVDWRSREIGRRLRWLIDGQRRYMQRRRIFKPRRFKIFEEPLAATLASKAALAIASEPARSVEKIVQFTHTTPALSCAATCSETLMLSLHTQAARPYTVLLASSTASRGVRNVIAASTGPNISCCATTEAG